MLDKISASFQAIGVLDSGLGGISILKSIWQLLPQERTIYLADSYYAPYGNKQPDFIIKRTLNLCEHLVKQQVKAIVIACNTATTIAIDEVRKHINHIPIIGVEPGVKPALKITKTNVIGVLATENTLNSDNFKNLLQEIQEAPENKHIKFILQAGYGLVECIEQQNISLNNQELINLCKKYIDNMLKQKVDTVVLGCTHYPFLLDILTTLYKDINFIQTSTAVVKHLYSQLQENSNSYIYENNKNPNILCSSLDTKHLQNFVQNNCDNMQYQNCIYKIFDV